MVKGDSREKVIIFRDKHTNRHFIIILYIIFQHTDQNFTELSLSIFIQNHYDHCSNVFAKDRSDLHSLGVIGARAMGRKYDVSDISRSMSNRILICDYFIIS